MATKRFIANQARGVERHTITVTAVAVGGTLSWSLNGKLATYVCVTGDTTSSAATAWAAAVRASLDGEFSQVQVTVAGAVLTVAALQAGRYVTATGQDAFTLSTAGGATATTAVLTAGLSPADADDTVNWAGASLPAGGDDVWFEDAKFPALYNLSAFAGVSLASLTVRDTFAGNGVGLPKFAPEGYLEYRGGRLALTGCGILTVSLPAGAGKEAYRFHVGAAVCALVVRGQGAAAVGSEPVEWLGTHANNSVEVYGGAVAVAPYVGDVATVATVKAVSGVVRLGAGVTVTDVDLQNSTLDSRVGMTVLTVSGPQAVAVLRDTAAVGTLTLERGAACFHNAAANITTLVVGPGCSIDFGGSVDPCVITTRVKLYAGSTLSDPNGRVTMSDGFQTVECSAADVTINIGVNRSLNTI